MPRIFLDNFWFGMPVTGASTHPHQNFTQLIINHKLELRVNHGFDVDYCTRLDANILKEWTYETIAILDM